MKEKHPWRPICLMVCWIDPVRRGTGKNCSPTAIFLENILHFLRFYGIMKKYKKEIFMEDVHHAKDQHCGLGNHHKFCY